jgi:hypothetical protein
MRNVVGFIHRVAYGALLAFVLWYSCVVPAAFGEHTSVQKALCYTLDYPIAVVGLLTYPARGIDLFFHQGSTWCEFCTPGQAFWYHMRFSVPVYVALFYVPTLLHWITRKVMSKRKTSVEVRKHA